VDLNPSDDKYYLVPDLDLDLDLDPKLLVNPDTKILVLMHNTGTNRYLPSNRTRYLRDGDLSPVHIDEELLHVSARHAIQVDDVVLLPVPAL